MNIKWTRVVRKGVRAELYEATTPNGIVTVRQRTESVTWQAVIGNMEIASGYTSTACKRAAEQRIEAMSAKGRGRWT